MLAIVIPARNEATRLGPTLGQARAYLRERGAGLVIVVDNGSTDGTAAVAESGDAAVVREQRPGKGAAVRAGVLAALARPEVSRVLVMDADGPVPLLQGMAALERVLGEGAEVAFGSRGLPESVLIPAQPWHRQVLGRLFSLFVRSVTGMPFIDTQCGFKLFTRHAATALFPLAREAGYAWDIEVLLRAWRSGLALREVAVTWGDQPGSKVRVLHDGLDMGLKVLALARSTAAIPIPRQQRQER